MYHNKAFELADGKGCSSPCLRQGYNINTTCAVCFSKIMHFEEKINKLKMLKLIFKLMHFVPCMMPQKWTPVSMPLETLIKAPNCHYGFAKAILTDTVNNH